jgi:hypothetical protein
MVEEPKEDNEEEDLADPMEVEPEESYLKEFDTDGSLKDTAMKEAGDDWVRMTAEKKKRYDKTQFMWDQARKYVKMKQASYVRQRRMEAVQSQREHKKEKARREARQMPSTPPGEEMEEEEELISRITQLWRAEYEITSVHSNLEYALTDLRRLMATMGTVHTHEVAIHSDDQESVTMVRIRKGMQVCQRSTKALMMAMTVRPCVTHGDTMFEESEAVDWQTEMRDWTWEHKELMELVHVARAEETNEATQEGRVYVVVCTPRLVKTAHQARTLGKDILEWLAKECVMFRLLPEGMVNPKERTEEQVQEIVEHWLEHGELSIAGERTVAQSRHTKTGQRARAALLDHGIDRLIAIPRESYLPDPIAVSLPRPNIQALSRTAS